ncbi:pseudaminic acid synthase [Hamadaea tsunoensis]|uniref:pseudaminic acid synthase n=1 Tax=Hamadaea tsunoensis TaxID=53368 RepID=UPI000550B30F|nr:pseudaminic acid synthase [Hamadaea tsunoensis]
MTIRIGDHLVGPDQRPFIVAELSGNHGGSLDRALAIVDAVADSGVHALKLQTYTPDTITIDHDGPQFRVSAEHPLWGGENLYQLYRRAHTPYAWHEAIFARGRERGLTVFSAPFDPTAVELLEGLGCPAYKIASSELVDLPLVALAAATGKPLILSTGMASLVDIAQAVSTARAAGAREIILLACTAAYPAPAADSNLRRIPLLSDVFDLPVGLSDHTLGLGAAVASVGLGAVLIEKHVALGSDSGVDAAFSLTPAEFANLVTETGRAFSALGTDHIGPSESEAEGLRFRRSLYVVADVEAGEEVTASNVRSIRPAGGLAPGETSQVLGRRFRSAVRRGTPLTWDLV